MIPQRDCSGHLSCKNREVGEGFSRDFCTKHHEGCEYCTKHHRPVLVDMEEFKKWWNNHWDKNHNLLTPLGPMRHREESWKAAMEKVLEFITEIPHNTENERRLLIAIENRIEKELGRSDN